MPLQILLNVKPPRVGVRVRALLRLALMQWLLLEVVSIGPGKDYWGDTHQHCLDRVCLSGLLSA